MVSISNNSVGIGTLVALLGVKQVYGFIKEGIGCPWGIATLLSCCPFTPCAAVLPSLHTLKETITLSSFFFCLLFHIKWELCLFRLPLQLNTHVIQARDKMEEHFFFKFTWPVTYLTNCFTTLSWHLIEEPIRSHSGFVE